MTRLEISDMTKLDEGILRSIECLEAAGEHAAVDRLDRCLFATKWDHTPGRSDLQIRKQWAEHCNSELLQRVSQYRDLKDLYYDRIIRVMSLTSQAKTMDELGAASEQMSEISQHIARQLTQNPNIDQIEWIDEHEDRLLPKPVRHQIRR